MVFGLSIGNKRRSSRVPDLSRYDYHYNGDGPSAGYYKSHDLSADAAFAASVNSGGRSRSMVNTSLRAGQGPGPRQGQGHGQGHGMAHHETSFAPRKAAAGNSRVSSSRGGQRQRSGGPVPYGYGSNQGYAGSAQAARSYSLTSGRHVGGKQGKKQGKVGGSKASSRAGSLTNSIIIKTQEVKDMSGRTQSITTQTIRRVNGMEYVETTTQTTGALADDPQFHFQQFSENNGLSEEEEIGMEFESESEPEPHTEPDAEHEYISGSEPESKSEPESEPEHEPELESEPESKPESKPEPEAEDGEFADASEIIEEEDHTQFFAKVNKVKVDAAGAPLASHTGNNSTNNNNSNNNNNKNNYNNYNTNNNDNSNNDNSNTSVHDKKTHRKSAMSKRMTLRDSEVPDTTTTTTESPVNHTYQGKRRVQAPPVVAPSSSRKVLTQEEMYAMALEIAQQRYAESQQQQQQRSLQGNGNAVPVQVQGERPSQSIKSAGSHSGMEPILEDTAENPVEGTTAAGPTGVSGAPVGAPAGGPAGGPAASGPTVASGVPVPVPTNEKSRRPKKKVKSLLDRVVQFSQENTLSQPSGKHRRGHRGQVDAQAQAQVQPQPQPQARPQPQVQPQPHAPVQTPAQTPAQTPVQTQTEAPQTLATTQETSSSSSLRHAGPQQEEEPAPVPAPNAQAEAQANHVTQAPAPAPAQAKGSPKKTSFFKKLFKTKDKHH